MEAKAVAKDMDGICDMHIKYGKVAKERSKTGTSDDDVGGIKLILLGIPYVRQGCV